MSEPAPLSHMTTPSATNPESHVGSVKKTLVQHAWDIGARTEGLAFRGGKRRKRAPLEKLDCDRVELVVVAPHIDRPPIRTDGGATVDITTRAVGPLVGPVRCSHRV